MTEPAPDWSDLPHPVDVSDNAAGLAMVDAVIAGGPFDADWDSLSAYEPPRWYHDARFGIFIHWGVYSVPAFGNEWYAREMYQAGTASFDHHREHFGEHREFGYKDFIPGFHMRDFDPDAWAALFRASGAQYVVPVAEHHDGFPLYDTARSRWKATAMGPRRDVFGELLAATARAGMVPGASSHRAEHWFFMNGGARFDSDVLDPRFFDFYGPAQWKETAPNEQFLEDWLLRTVEFIDAYRPQVLWFDWWIEEPAFEPYRLKLAAYYYNRAAQWQRGVAINYKWEAFRPGTAVYDIERGAVAGIRDDVWQNDTSVSKNSWGWIEGHDYKSVDDLVAELADTVSKNGNLLLNVGPKPDGTIPAPEQELLRGVGAWLAANGAAIFGTRPWVTAMEGPNAPAAGSFVDGTTVAYSSADIRFTTRQDVVGETVYAILLRRPDDGIARIRSFGVDARLLARDIRDVVVLGHASPAVWNRGSDALEVTVGEGRVDIPGVVVAVRLQPETVPVRHE